MAKKRNFKAEYQRRIANAAKRGLSRSQARGHARAGEAPVRAKPIESDPQLEAALRLLRHTSNQSRAAREAGVSAERFRRFLRSNSLAERQGKRWHITDNRTRTMPVRTDGEERLIELRDFEQASLNGRHLAATDTFSRTNDIDLLRPFEGQSVIGADGQSYPLETHPSTLHRLFNAGGEEFHVIYQLNM
jgi:hypothetical protein